MIEPELQKDLEAINHNLEEIKKKTGPSSLWRAFFMGILSALGYVVGIAIAVVILGWILQKTGLLTKFKQKAKDFSDLVEQAKQITAPSANNNEQGNGQQGTVTLPDGRQYRLNSEQQ